MKKMLITGSSGLIGSEVADHFCGRGWSVFGIDNNLRADFFGPAGDTRWNQRRLQSKHESFKHYDFDIRSREMMQSCLEQIKPEVIVHTAAQPSHDLAAARPYDDFEVNALGTLNVIESTRRAAPEATFIHMSTNKVYGDAPNELKLTELESRWDYADEAYKNGIPETFRIDQSKHSLFGASKLSGDILVQEYGRYFGMKTACLRGGCLTGPSHSGVELHGFLSYLMKCNVQQKPYKIFGYKGKQVRDNIHSLDVARFIEHFIENPRIGEVYNIGGGRSNSCSIIEAFSYAKDLTGREMIFEYIPENRSGDHICYISDLSKLYKDFPSWRITKSLGDIFQDLHVSARERVS